MQRSDSSYWRTSEVARLLALVESERRYYQDLFAALPVAVAVVAEDQSLLSVNREFRVRFGLKGEDLTRLRVADLLPDPKLEQALAQLLTGEQRQAAVDIRLGPRRLHVGMRHTQGWQDQADTEILMTVEEVSEAEQNARALPRVNGAVFWLIDRESERLACLSPGAEADFGLPPEAWQNLENWAETRIHQDDRRVFLDFYRRPEETWQASISYRLFDGEANLRHCRDAASADGDEVRVMTMDRSADEKSAHRARLKARIESSGKLSARLAHVSNNLLMIVGGYSAELMESLEAGDPRRGDIHEIQNAAERLGRLTAQMNPMQAEVAAAGHFELPVWAESQAVEASGKPVRVPVDEMEINALVESLRLAWGELKLAVQGRPELGEAEFLFECEGRTEAEAEGLLDPFAGPKSVGDPEFGPMRQLRRLLEAGCQAWVEECRTGARLVLVAPAEASDAEMAGPAGEQPRGSVLLAEDEEGLRSLLAKALRRQRCEVVEAATAEEALAALEQRGAEVDVLVTDLTMPGTGGGKLAQAVRKASPKTQIIFMTGAAEDSEAAEMLRSDPGVSLLSKPFAVEELVQRVIEILDRPKARGASAG